MELRAQVPVSIRAADERGQLGNQIAVLRGPIPVYVEDPVKRLEICRQGMEGIKDSKQALGAEVISRFNDFAPPTLLAQAARVNFSTRLFNLVVTNVPGPQIPLYVLGRELEDIFPVGFLPPEQALFVAIMSYNGGINFGLLADYDAMTTSPRSRPGSRRRSPSSPRRRMRCSSARRPTASPRPPSMPGAPNPITGDASVEESATASTPSRWSRPPATAPTASARRAVPFRSSSACREPR